MIELLSQTPTAPAPVKAPTAKPQANGDDARDESARFSDVLSEETQQSEKSGTAEAPKADDKQPKTQLTQGENVEAEAPSEALLEASFEVQASNTSEEALRDEFAALTSLEADLLAAEDTPIAQQPSATPNDEAAVAKGAASLLPEKVATEMKVEQISAPASEAIILETDTASVEDDAAIGSISTPIAETLSASAALPNAAPIQAVATSAAKPAIKIDLGSLKDGGPLKSGDTVALKEPGQQLSPSIAESEDGADLGGNPAAKTNEQSAQSDAATTKTPPVKASFEQLLAAQTETQPLESASSALAAKAVPTDGVAAKPVPEVLVQVPQQRADMAAKQVGIELARQVKNGDTQFVVRMDPPELGKLDVRMTVTKAGEVQATIVVEREATLDLLSRDAKALERSLADAGLKMDQNALNFSLKQNHSDGFEGKFAAASSSAETGEPGDDDITETLDSAALAHMQISSGRPLDVVA